MKACGLHVIQIGFFLDLEERPVSLKTLAAVDAAMNEAA